MIYSNESHHDLQPSPPRTFFCYWDWCRLSFSTVDELTSHVRHNHIWKLQPMSKREITRMRREDAEVAQSMSDSLGSSVLVHHHKGSAMPQTTPTRREFSDFAQPSSPSITSLPQSPDLSTLSLRPNLMAQIDAFDQRHSRLLEVTQGDRSPLLHHSHSQSSSSSQDAVERQLTQDEEAAEQLEHRSPRVTPQSNRGRSFHSGTLYISPSPQRTKPRSAFRSPQRVIYPPQVSQETSSSGVSQSSDSCPLVLQTQAPYQSQSYNLSLSQA